MTGRRINREVGIASVAGFIPLRKLDIDFIFCVASNVMSGAIGEQPKHSRRVHGVNVALDNPLIGPEAHILGRK